MIALDDAVDRPEAGGKARTLARLRAAGLPVEDGFVVLPGEDVDGAELARRLAALGGAAFVVRSSASVEDAPGRSAAGVFRSVAGVGAAEVAAAIEAVRASLGEAAAVAYLAATGATVTDAPRDVARGAVAGAAATGAGAARMAVLVQPLVGGLRHGVLHAAPAEAGGLRAEERPPSAPEWGDVEAVRVADDEPLARVAATVAALLGGPVDLEYARTHEGLRVFQARPLQSTSRRPDAALWALHAPGRYTQDAEHNPAPLSAAQASLVHHLAAVPSLARQALVRGYLYVSAERPPAPSPVAPRSPAALARFFAAELAPDCDRALRPLEGATPGPALAAALAAYAHVAARTLGELGPLLRAARDRLDQLLQRSVNQRLVELPALLDGTGGLTLARDAALWALGRAASQHAPALRAEYLARFGAYAPVWDVASPPDDESPRRVEAAAALVARGPSPEEAHAAALDSAARAERAVAKRLRAADRSAFAAALAEARVAHALKEDDDALFFRAQRVVRRPLLALGTALAREGVLDEAELVFELPIELAARLADPAAPERREAQELATRARAARLAATELVAPSAFVDGKPLFRGTTGALRGAGTSGRARGRAVLVDADTAGDDLARDLGGAGAVLVVRALLPSLTWLLPGAAALVTDQGGALSHAATLCREYGVPAVLGTGNATRLLRAGEELLVDADAGVVVRLGATWPSP